jgi:four helix bundle protein
MSRHKYDLEDRLVEFSSQIIDIVESISPSRAGSYIAGQLIRCGLAPSLLYGEVQASESRKDFVHKMKIGLKELKETRICLKLLSRKKLTENSELLTQVAKENEELIAIFSKSIDTAIRNQAAS